MRRALPVIGMTAAGLLLLLNFKTAEQGAAGTTATAAGPTPRTPVAGGAGGTGGNGGNGGTGGGGDGLGRSPGPAGGGTSPTTTVPPSGGAAAAPHDGTASGPVVRSRFGPVQVQATVSGGRLVDVTALELPGGSFRSERINAAAAPLLREAALEAQSASFDVVSGATVTSDAYRVSLQAALDALGLR